MSRKIAKQILTARGVHSRVRDKFDGVQDFIFIGHVGIYDFDGRHLRKSKVLEETKDHEGINALWRSSPTGYHHWNLTVRSAKDIAWIGNTMHTDCKHIAHGCKQGEYIKDDDGNVVRAGNWVLRIAPKIKDGAIYKDSPELLQVWCNPSKLPQSRPHYNLLCGLAEKAGKRVICNVDDFNWIGVTATIVTYNTMTDKLKRDVVKDVTKKKYPIVTKIGDNLD